MDKAMEMGKTSTKGSVQLFVGTSISTIIRAIGAIVLGIFILQTDYGLYAVALIPGTTLALLQDWGISSALTRYCAKYRGTNQPIEQKKVIIAGLLFLAATGFLLTIASLLTVNFFAYTVYNRPTSAPLIAVVSVTMLSGAIASGIASIFTGYEKMMLNSYLALISAIAYGLLAPILVIAGYGALGAILGYTIASVIQAIISAVFLYSFVWKTLPSYKIILKEITGTLKSLLHYGIPLGVGSLIGNLGTPVYSFLMATYVNDAMIGDYKIATNFIIIISFVTNPIATVLFPAFSKVDLNTEKALLQKVYASSVKYTVLFLVPVTMAMIVLATPIVGTLYGDKWPTAPLLLALSAVFYLIALTGHRSMGSLLTATGDTKLLLEMSALSLALSFPTAFLLVPTLGIIGIVIGLPIAALPSTVVGLYLVWKRYGTKADLKSSAKIFVAAAIASISTFIFLSYVAAPYIVLLTGGIIIFLVVYLLFTPLVGGINQYDISDLRTMLSGLGVISKLLEIPFKLVESILKLQVDVKIQKFLSGRKKLQDF